MSCYLLGGFKGSIKATDSSNDQKSMLETKSKRANLSFAVILRKRFLEDCKSERKWLWNSSQHKNIISLNCVALILTLQNSARSNQLWPLFSALQLLSEALISRICIVFYGMFQMIKLWAMVIFDRLTILVPSNWDGLHTNHWTHWTVFFL